MTRPPSAILVVAALLLIPAAACGGGNAEVPPTPSPQPTPRPTVTGPLSVRVGRAGPIRTSVEASCEGGPVGADLIVRYEVQAEAGLISRVRLLVDDEEVEDSGELAQTAYARIATLPVAPGRRHSYQVRAETPDAPPVDVRGRVDCPGELAPIF